MAGEAFTIDLGLQRRRLTDLDNKVRLSAFVTVAEEARAHEKDLERLTEGAGLGRLARAWNSKVYGTPNSADPAAIVYPKGSARTRGAIRAYTQGATVRGKRGQFLAVPLPAAGTANTPAEFEARKNVKLRLVITKRGARLLVLDNATLGRTGRARRLPGKRAGPLLRGGSTVPIFVLIPQVRVNQRFTLEGSQQLAENRLRVRWLRRVKVIFAEGQS